MNEQIVNYAGKSAEPISGADIALERIDLALSQLRIAGTDLETKLRPVTTVQPVEDGKSVHPNCGPRSSISPLTDRLHSFADTVGEFAYYMRLLHGRIDL